MGSSCTQVVYSAQAFAFFGGIPCGISHDNSRVLDSNVIGSRQRKLTNRFLRLKSHSLFRAHFYRVARPVEKGVAKDVIKFAYLNFFVPVPQVHGIDERNRLLVPMCRNDLGRRVRGKSGTNVEQTDYTNV
jgi:transposase